MSKKMRYYLGAPFDGVFLTKREYDCYLGLQRGMKYREIADLLGLRLRTVEFYMANIREKLACPNKELLLDWLSQVQIQYRGPSYREVLQNKLKAA